MKQGNAKEGEGDDASQDDITIIVIVAVLGFCCIILTAVFAMLVVFYVRKEKRAARGSGEALAHHSRRAQRTAHSGHLGSSYQYSNEGTSDVRCGPPRSSFPTGSSGAVRASRSRGNSRANDSQRGTGGGSKTQPPWSFN